MKCGKKIKRSWRGTLSGPYSLKQFARHLEENAVGTDKGIIASMWLANKMILKRQPIEKK